MTAALADLGWADAAGRTPSDREPGTCRVCGKAVCSHPDALFAGVVVIDDRSDPGSWARHLRHTDCMRDRTPAHTHSPTETGARLHVR